MPRRKLIIGLISIAFVAIGTGWWITARNREPEISHEEAMAAWPELVANNFQGDRKRIAKTFLRCFQVGDPMSKYQELLATAQSNSSRPFANNEIYYQWNWDWGHGGEGDYTFNVVTEGDNPPTITRVFIAEICW